MIRKSVMLAAALAAVSAAPAAAQLGGRIGVEPFIGYGFYGDLPNGQSLEADVAYGGRAFYQISPQFAAFGMYQRSTPELSGTLGIGEIDVDHWSAGLEFSYVPRGGAEGMLPLLLEAGLGQARYEGGGSDFAANLGIASALRFSRNFSIRYGANDYISNFDDRGVVNQIFVRVGAELRF